VKRFTTAGLFLLFLLGAPAHARAQEQEEPGDAVAAAREHFSRGETLYRLGKFEKALAQFEAALKLIKRPAIVLNMAQCLRNLKRHDRAIFYYKLYLSEYERKHPGWPPPYKKDVEKHISKLEARLKQKASRPTIWIQGVKEAGAQVLVDGEPRVLTPMTRPLSVDSGLRWVEVRAPGHRPWSKKVTVERGQRLVIRARLEPLPGRSMFWLISMISGAALAGGAEALALVYTSRANEHFRDTADYQADRDIAIGGHVAAGVMGAFAVTSLVLYLTSGGGEEAPAAGQGAALIPTRGGVAGAVRVAF